MASGSGRSSRFVRGILRETSEKWVEVPHPSRNVLRDRIVQVFWHGTAQEVRLLVKTMCIWQKEKYADVRGGDEVLQTEEINGFRAFLERAVGKPASERVKNAILQAIQHAERNTTRLSTDQRRAQMLLQASGFLDISKVMEYKAPQEDYNLWAKPRAAQLVLNNPDQINYLPKFGPAVCSHCSCTIRGTQFRCVTNCGRPNCTVRDCLQPYCRQPEQRPVINEPLLFCETCKRANVHPERHLQKFEKRCILREAITPRRRHHICACENKPPYSDDDDDDDGGGRDRGVNLNFAVDGGYIHQPHCPISRLKRRYEGAKFQELRRYRTGNQARGMDGARGTRNRVRKASSRMVGSSAQVVAPPIEFGNVHMFLTVGPIIIENGIDDSKAGARISLRKPPHLAMVTERGEGKNPMMCVNPERSIFQRYGRPEQPRRIKACMKQVVGGCFTGLCDADARTELDVINALVEGSKRCWSDGTKTQAYLDRIMARVVNHIVSKLRVLIGEKVIRYFDFITAKLFDPRIELTWHQTNNHCQQFCARILDFRAFGSFLATTPTCKIHVPRNPLYLVSFVCPPGSYDSPRRIRPGTKNQAPNGLTEEYLLRFRCHGHHEDSDHIDTLRQYWNDWGAFGGTLYKHQDLFPWDCTEAYRQGESESPVKCNSCTITNHVWSYPFDTWSIAQLHLCRDRSLYSPPNGSDGRALKDEEWMRNRLDILSALRALTVVTVAMANTTYFRGTCRWNRERRALTPDTASRSDRLKLSGIYRAQPHSHSFEQSKYHDCTLAKWALKSREDQIKEYEKLRDHRAENLAEIPPRPPRSSNRHRFRVPHDVRNEQPISNDIWVGFRADDRHQNAGDENCDSVSEEASDSEEEYVNEEYEFEEGGGLIPSTLWADPDDGYDQYSTTEEDGVDFHDQGTGSCDYALEDKWLDVTDDIDTCRDPIVREEARIAEINNQRIIIELLVAGVPYNEIVISMVNPDDPDPTSLPLDEATYQKIIDQLITDGGPLDLFVPLDINPDGPDPADVPMSSGEGEAEHLHATGVPYEEMSPPSPNPDIPNPAPVLNSNAMDELREARVPYKDIVLSSINPENPNSYSFLVNENNDTKVVGDLPTSGVAYEDIFPSSTNVDNPSSYSASNGYDNNREIGDEVLTIRYPPSITSPLGIDPDHRNQSGVSDRYASSENPNNSNDFTSGSTAQRSTVDSYTSSNDWDNSDDTTAPATESKKGFWSRLFKRNNNDSDYERELPSSRIDDNDNNSRGGIPGNTDSDIGVGFMNSPFRSDNYSSGVGNSYSENNGYSSGGGLFGGSSNDYSSGGGLFGDSSNYNSGGGLFGGSSNDYSSGCGFFGSNSNNDYSSWGWGGSGSGSGWGSSSSNNDSSW